MENDNLVENWRQNVAENLEVARLQNSLIFQIEDDEPIPSLDASRSSAATRTDRSPRLNHKRKRYSNGSKSSCAEPSADALLLANAIRNGTATLASALLVSGNPEPASTAAPISNSLGSSEDRINKIDKIEARVGRLQDMVRQVLEAVTSLTGNATESTEPAAGRSWTIEKGFDKAVSYAVGGASGGS